MRYDLTTSQKAILLTKNYMHANEKIIYNLIKKKKNPYKREVLADAD